MADTGLRGRTSAARKATVDASAFGGAQLRHAAISIWSCQIVVAVVVLSRRLSGAIDADLPAIVPCLVAGIALALSLLGAALFARGRRFATNERTRTKPSIFGGKLVEIAATFVPPLVLGIALLPANVTLAVLGLTCLACAAAVMWLLIDEQLLHGGVVPLREEILSSDFSVRPSVEHDERRFAVGDELAEFAAPEVNAGCGEVAVGSAIAGAGNERRRVAAVAQEPDAESVVADETIDERVTQWLQRAEEPAGGESLSGRVRVKFAAGQQQETLHLPFSPPFARVPELFCETDEDGTFRLKAAAVHPYGARIEIRRTGRTDAPAEVEVHVFAQVEAMARSDAA